MLFLPKMQGYLNFSFYKDVPRTQIWERFLSTLRERIEHINKVIRKFQKHCFKNVGHTLY